MSRLESLPSSANIREEYEHKIKELTSQHQAQLEVLTNKMGGDMKDNLAALEEELREEYDVKMSKAAQTQSSLREEYEDKIKELTSQHQAQLEVLTNKMGDNMKDNLAAMEELRKEYEAKISTIRKFHNSELDEREEANSKAVGEKKAYQWLLEREREKTEELENENAREKTISNQYRAEIESIREEYEDKIEELRSQLAVLTNSHRYPLRKRKSMNNMTYKKKL